ncbi:WD40 repeat domain-containing serine/threonine protein kinase [Tundrisphaera sp. TA3]|uniref:WD40 repeat domain-containing serine/threonine protein kinase n=1 Tax=Tundrisphaera sp. TA3 TaxID=3435775 RepID=UPI003EB9F0F2
MFDLSAAEAAFTAALRLADPDEREAFLDRACRGDATLRDAVDRLLAAHADLGDFLDPVAPTEDASAGAAGTPGLGPGALLAGRYELIEVIGEGGMGAVWSARQVEPVRRVVAVKLIRAGMDGRRVLARFEAERQALALMDHSHIARVFDGGEAPDGRPFFVMELVDGVPITEYCDRQKLTLRERLELFVPVCWAIQHAHQKGVIHRDIKPRNVLIEVHDGHPVPKVIDFGIAKATGPSLGGTTLITEFGDVVGTPEYMSPEQADLDNLDVDTRSDVYSLGVLLYELLTGSTPIARDASRRGGMLELLRAVREDEPPRPSQKLGASAALPSLAAARGAEPRRLAASVRGELDWIVMKALEKDRDRRFESVGHLAADIRRHLAGEPVLAAPPDLGYRLRKRFHRHRGPILAGGLTLLALLVGVIGTSWGLLRADAERARAVRATLDERRARMAEAARADEAAQARREAARGQAELAMGHGQALCEQGEIAQGMGWLTRSLGLAGEASDAPLARAARIDLVDWSARLGRRLARLVAPSPPLQVAFRPDGRGLVVLGEDGVLRGWDSRSWQDLSPAPADAEAGLAGPIAFDPRGDGAFVAFDRAGRGAFRDPARGLTGGAAVAHPIRAPIRGAAHLEGGRRLVTCGSDGALRWWDTGTGLPADGRAGPVGRDIAAIAVSPDGSRLVTGGEDGVVTERDILTGQPIGPALPHGSAVRQVVFLGDGRRIAVLTGEGRVRVWDRASRVSALPSEGSAVVGLAVAPGGEWFATGSEGGTVRLWDSATLHQEGPTSKFDVAVRSLSFRPDGRALAVGLEDGSIPIWEIPPPGPIAPPKAIPGPVRVVGFSRDGSDLVAVGGGGPERWCAVRPDGPCRRCPGSACGPRRLPAFRGEPIGVTAVSPDGRLIAAASAGGDGRPVGARLILLDAETGAVLGTRAGWPGTPAGLCFSPDSRTILTWGNEPGSVSLRGVETGAEARPLARSLGAAVLNAAFSPDGTTLLLGCRDGKARLWDVARDVEVSTDALPFHAFPITAVGFDPKTPRLVTGCHAGTVRLWDSASGAMLCDVRGNAGEVTAIAFSPDGSTLLTASVDAAARFWDVATGRQLGPPLRHSDAVLCVAFHPDGQSVATGARDGTVWQWPVPSAPMEGDLGQIERIVQERTGLRPPGR